MTIYISRVFFRLFLSISSSKRRRRREPLERSREIEYAPILKLYDQRLSTLQKLVHCACVKVYDNQGPQRPSEISQTLQQLVHCACAHSHELTRRSHFMKPLTNKRKDFKLNYICSQNFNKLKNLNNGSECDTGSENVIIPNIHFCKLVTGFK